MKESALQFVTPMSTPRPRGARLLTAFGPQLGRTVRAFDHAAFRQWVRLEVDPGVIASCEHPCCAGANDDGSLIDFWAAGPGQEEMLVVERGQGSTKLPRSVRNVPLRLVPAAEQAAAAVWVANWLHMIPVSTRPAGRRPSLSSSRCRVWFVGRWRFPLVEHELSVGDPAVVRGTIFELLRTGHLIAPSLHTEPPSLHTVVEPTP